MIHQGGMTVMTVMTVMMIKCFPALMHRWRIDRHFIIFSHEFSVLLEKVVANIPVTGCSRRRELISYFLYLPFTSS